MTRIHVIWASASLWQKYNKGNSDRKEDILEDVHDISELQVGKLQSVDTGKSFG